MTIDVAKSNILLVTAMSDDGLSIAKANLLMISGSDNVIFVSKANLIMTSGDDNVVQIAKVNLITTYGFPDPDVTNRRVSLM